jgi:transposase-like protein
MTPSPTTAAWRLKPSPKVKAEIKKLYDEGYSMREIGKKFGVNATTILHHLKHARTVDRIADLEDRMEKLEYLISKILLSQ